MIGYIFQVKSSRRSCTRREPSGMASFEFQWAKRKYTDTQWGEKPAGWRNQGLSMEKMRVEKVSAPMGSQWIDAILTGHPRRWRPIRRWLAMRLRLVVMVLQMRRRRVWRRCDAAQRAAKAATQIGHSTRRRTGSDQVCRRCWRRRRRRLGWSGRLMVVVVVVVRGRWRRLAARSRQFAGTEFEFALRLRWLARLKFQRRSQRRRAGRRLFAFAPGEALQSRAHRPQIGRAAVQSERRRPTTSGRLRFQRQRLLLQRCRRSVAQNRRRIRRRRHHRSTGDRFDHSLALCEPQKVLQFGWSRLERIQNTWWRFGKRNFHEIRGRRRTWKSGLSPWRSNDGWRCLWSKKLRRKIGGGERERKRERSTINGEKKHLPLDESAQSLNEWVEEARESSDDQQPTQFFFHPPGRTRLFNWIRPSFAHQDALDHRRKAAGKIWRDVNRN